MEIPCNPTVFGLEIYIVTGYDESLKKNVFPYVCGAWWKRKSKNKF